VSVRVHSWLRKSGQNGVEKAPGAVSLLAQPMNFSHFVRIDRERMGLERHYVVHTGQPKFTLELTPDHEAPDKIGRGIIKRVCVPNSWAGDYGQYGKMLAAAQEFFAQSHPPAGEWRGGPYPRGVGG
jgi:hypothetical protein